MKKTYSNLFAFLTLLTLALSPLQVSAIAMSSDGDPGDTGGGTIFDTNTSMSFGLNKATYSPGENIRVSGQATATYCTNSIGDLTVTASTNGNSIQLFSVSLAGAQTASGSGNLTAPMTPGSYAVEVSAVGVVTGQSGAGPSQPIGTSRSGSESLPYTVVAAPAPTANVWFTINTLLDNVKNFFTTEALAKERLVKSN